MRLYKQQADFWGDNKDMALRKFYIRNGQSWNLAQVPLYEMETFRNEILEECRLGARVVNLFGALEENGDIRMFALVSKDDDARLSLFSVAISKDRPIFKSLAPELPAVQRFEREIAEQFAVAFEGHPWFKPLRYHQNFRNVPDLWPEISVKPIPGDYLFYKIKGEEVHEVAVGPVHAGIIEPGHFRFQCHGEEILHLEIQLGYQHRGIERMMEEVTLERAVLLAESIAGDTVIGHVMAYCSLIESLSECAISPRAEALRAIVLELERLSNHIGDLGALGADIGFLPTSAYFGRLRGEFLNMLMEFSGNRYGRSFCRPGGVLFDLDPKMTNDFRKRLALAKKELKELADLFFSKPSVLARLEGMGIVSEQTAKELGLVGPAARASGLSRDVRTDHAFGIYRFWHLPVSLALTGDVFARAQIRWLEAQRSLDFLLELLDQIPKGELCKTVPPRKPDQMALAMVEGWRGEIVHVAISDAQSKIIRYKIKDPSFHDWDGLAMAVRGAQISDFPLCNKSFNLSYAGHDL
jgi:Ni,Fe-hydrogenase III large subunit/Ni,Fe-hydrogenase III component G